jgi:hypothetical protein
MSATQQEAIFGPVLGTIILTLIVWVYMYSKRIPFLQNCGIPLEQLVKPGELARLSPPAVNNPSDNLKNLFEIPVLFYVLALYLFATKQVDNGYVNAAWVFFIFRVLHSLIHCTYNTIMHRFYAYAIATLAVGYMTLRATVAHFAY